MTSNAKLQVGLLVGWFVIVDILLRTSGSTLNVIGNLGSIVQMGIAFFYPSSFSSSTNPIIISVLALAALFLSMMAFLLISSTMQIWYAVIKLTQQLAKFLLANESTEDGKEIVQSIFGDFKSGTKDNLLWHILKLFANTWSLMLFLQLLAAILRAF